jgi:hypothetical protein
MFSKLNTTKTRGEERKRLADTQKKKKKKKDNARDGEE